MDLESFGIIVTDNNLSFFMQHPCYIVHTRTSFGVTAEIIFYITMEKHTLFGLPIPILYKNEEGVILQRCCKNMNRMALLTL